MDYRKGIKSANCEVLTRRRVTEARSPFLRYPALRVALAFLRGMVAPR